MPTDMWLGNYVAPAHQVTWDRLLIMQGEGRHMISSSFPHICWSTANLPYLCRQLPANGMLMFDVPLDFEWFDDRWPNNLSDLRTMLSTRVGSLRILGNISPFDGLVQEHVWSFSDLESSIVVLTADFFRKPFYGDPLVSNAHGWHDALGQYAGFADLNPNPTNYLELTMRLVRGVRCNFDEVIRVTNRYDSLDDRFAIHLQPFLADNIREITVTS